MTRITTHLRTNVVAYVALFFALSAGAYAAGLQPNSVKSKHIRDGHVRAPDVGADAVTGPKVAQGSLGGGDLAANSLGGAQIAESTLGEVPRATIAGHGGYGRQSGGPDGGTFCNPSDNIYTTCASVATTPSAPARFLVVGRFRVSPSEVDGYGAADCRLGSSAYGGIPGTTLHVETLFDDYGEHATITGVTDVYQPGNYSFGIDCKEPPVSDNDVVIGNARVTAVAISPF